MMISLLLLVPAAAMGLVLGLSRLEDSLLQAPAGPYDEVDAVLPTTPVLR